MSAIDPAQLAGWFEARGPGLVLYARQWLNGAAAEDVVQEVFVKLLAGPRPPENVKAWLYVATRHAAISAARAAKSRSRREQAVAGERAEAAPLFQTDPAARLDAAAAEAALAELPPARREIVVLRLWGGLTLAEIAGVTGLPVSTVHHHYRAALASARAILEPSCPTTPPPPSVPTCRAR